MISGNETKILPHIVSSTAVLSNPSTINSSSTSASQQQQDLIKTQTSDLTSLFECPVCFDYVLPPIIQCQNGHLVCSSCRQKITCCPTCRVPISNNIRNLQMEKLAPTLLFPCKYSSAGCTQNLLYSDKPEHEDSCEFKPYSCPCPG